MDVCVRTCMLVCVLVCGRAYVCVSNEMQYIKLASSLKPLYRHTR